MNHTTPQRRAAFLRKVKSAFESVNFGGSGCAQFSVPPLESQYKIAMPSAAIQIARVDGTTTRQQSATAIGNLAIAQVEQGRSMRGVEKRRTTP